MGFLSSSGKRTAKPPADERGIDISENEIESMTKVY